ncbi:EAL domain-containing protein [Photobacterium ganghwense]|uniref:EAL domain-containing protein n=1 Tax=Photobacterium ganghwense TaxID=320778 RepID=UPI004057C3A7
MDLTFWRRWRLPALVFILGTLVIMVSSPFLGERLFASEAKERMDNLFDFYQKRYMDIGKEARRLATQLSFTCDEHDIGILRDASENPTVIQFLELQTPHEHCSVYGKDVSLIKDFRNKEFFFLHDSQYNAFMVEPYFNQRLKITFYLAKGEMILITEPFQNVFTDSEACINCFAMSLLYRNRELPIKRKTADQSYRLIASKAFTKEFDVQLYATEQGLREVVDHDVEITQMLLMSLLLSFSLILGLRKPPEKRLSDLIVHGLKNNEFVPYYQPIINTETHRVECCEVLIRWHRANGEVIAPNQFIPIAEHNGQILELTENLLDKVVHQFSETFPTGPTFSLSVNVTPQQLENHRFVDCVLNILCKGKLPAEKIAFEVTERTPFTDVLRAKEVLDRFKHHGISIKLDDAGTGYGGFSYLQSLPIDTLKIDKMFIDTIGTNDVKSSLLDAIILFAHHAGVELIAEGVESQTQVDYLQSKGVLLLQGYYFAKPMPFDELCQYLSRHHGLEIPTATANENKQEVPMA